MKLKIYHTNSTTFAQSWIYYMLNTNSLLNCKHPLVKRYPNQLILHEN